jgi:hypothetical protein
MGKCLSVEKVRGVFQGVDPSPFFFSFFFCQVGAHESSYHGQTQRIDPQQLTRMDEKGEDKDNLDKVTGLGR